MDELALKGEIVGISSVIKESYIGWKIWCWTTYKWWESYISYLEVLDEDTVSHSPMWLLVANCDYPRQDSLDTQRQHVRLHLTPMFHIWLAISSLQQMFLWLLLANCDYPSRFPRDRTSYIALHLIHMFHIWLAISLLEQMWMMVIMMMIRSHFREIGMLEYEMRRFCCKKWMITTLIIFTDS